MKRNITIAILAFACITGISAQPVDTIKPKEEKLMFPGSDYPAWYPGGTRAMEKFLRDNIKYPKVAGKKKTEGCVICTFVVGTDGYIRNIKIIKSVHPLLDAETVRLVKAMPRWIPGREDQKLTTTNYTLPAYFHSKSVTLARDSLYVWQERQKRLAPRM